MQKKGVIMAVSNSLTHRQEQGIASYLNRVDIRVNIESVVGKNTDTFIAGVVSAVQTNPTLSMLLYYLHSPLKHLLQSFSFQDCGRFLQ